jgi:tetratricopeptide (TPR) repeat protein
MDTVAAQQAMKIADLYIKETRNIDLKDKTEVRAARTTLALASEQLAKAYRADPDAIVEIDGTTFDVPFLRASVLIREAQTWFHFDINKSISLADQATKADPSDAIAFQMLGFFHMEAHNPKQAQAALTKAARLAPDNADILKDLDRAQHMGGLSVAAYKAADTGITLFNIFITIWRVVMFPFYIVGRIMLWFVGRK